MAPSALPYNKRTKVPRPAKKFQPFANIPVRTFCTSSMSVAERRSLAETLRGELESVREMQRRLAAAEAAITPTQRCATLLQRLTSHRHGWVFREPVDTVKLNIPDYYNVISHPMDLGTVGRRLESGGYSTPEEFAADVRLTFSNAFTYNAPRAPAHKMATTLSKLFEREWKEIERILAAGNGTLRASRRMTNEEKQALSSDLQSCLEDLPKRIVDLLSPYGQNDGGADVEIDIVSIGDDTLFEVRELLDAHMKEKAESGRGNHQLRRSEVMNDFEMADLSGTKKDCKGDGLNHDVDIGSSSSPLRSDHSLLLIKNDATQLRSSCNSNSSNSYSSSSYDSDADSSSGSDSDSSAAPVELPTNDVGSH